MEAKQIDNIMRAQAESLAQQKFAASENLAESLAQQKFAASENLAELTPEGTRLLLHELRVHQIQLEMQNEELRNAHLALEESRTRYMDLYDFAPVGYCSIAEKQVIVEANLTLSTLLGVSRKVLLGQSFTRFIFAADQDIFYQFQEQILAEQRFDTETTLPPHSIELRLKAGDGSPFWARLLAAQALNLGTRQFRLVISDISAQKSSANAQRLSNIALKNISQGVIMTCAEQWLLWTNAAFSAITGYSSAESIGRNCNFLQGPETDPLTITAIRSALKNHAEFNGEILNYRKDGTSFWNDLTITPVFDAPGVVSHYVGITRDVTARRLIEKANEETTMQLQLVIRGGDIGYWDWDVTDNTLAVNARWFTMLGLDPNGPAPGMHLWNSLVHPEDMHKLTHLMESVILNPNGTSGEAEIRVRHRAGHDVWLLDRFSVAARDSDGKPLRVVGTHLDITERKHAEQKAQHQLHELQRWQAVMLRREDRVLELKQEVNELLARHHQPPRYTSLKAL